MTELLCKLFIRNSGNVSDPRVRHKYGTLGSIVGIIVNFLLFLGKFFVGTFCGSIAITADALNNLSDAGSSVISLVSFKISAKPADRAHPFGHARIEYVASMVVSFIILVIGFELMKESISKIFNPEAPDKSIVAIIVLAASVLAKIWLGFFYRKVGKKIDSSIMCAASADSFSDVMSTGAVLITTLILIIWNINIDAYVGIAVSIFIFISGGRILNETKNSILGEAPDGEIVESIKQLVHEYPEALGVHDLMVHNYGPGNTIVSLHVEVDGSENIFTTHDVIDNIEKRMCEELNIQCTIHLDPIVTDDEKVNGYKNMTEKSVERVDTALKIHDFRVVEGATHTNLIFDVAVPFEIKSSDDEIKTKITSEIQKNNATFFTVITIDRC